MVDEETKTKEEQRKPPSEADTNGEETSKAPAKARPKIVLIIAGVVVLAVLGTVGYLVLAPSSEASDGAAITVTQDEGLDDAKPKREPSSRKSRRGSDAEDIPTTDIYFTDFPASVVNLGPSENFNYVYLKYGYNLELAEDKVRAEISKEMPKIAAVVDALMTGRKWDQIGNQRGRKALEREVVGAINEELETGEVINCYFITFVAQ